MKTNGGVNLLHLFFTFPVDFQLFSEVAAKQATSGVAALLMAETIKNEGFYVLYWLPLPPNKNGKNDERS